jgi:aspartate kinase
LEGLELAKAVDAVEFDLDQAGVSLLRLPDRPGVAARLFGAIAQQNLDVDLIIQSIHEGNTNDIAFTVTRKSLQQATAVADAIIPALGKNSRPELGEPEVKAEERPIAKVSIAGAGMIGRPRVAAQMFKTLADAGINIQMISTSEVKVSCAIDAEDCDRAVAELCKAFDVANSPCWAAFIIPQTPRSPRRCVGSQSSASSNSPIARSTRSSSKTVRTFSRGKISA